MAKQSVSINLDLRVVCAVLLLVIAGMLVAWRPWTAKNEGSTEKRTTTQTGQATIKAVPDSFQFNPYYELKNTSEVAAKANEVTDKLKSMGVADKDIKNNASSYDYYGPDYYNKAQEQITTLSLTVTVRGKEQAQKIQDYLLTTNPKGAITPYATFSSEKQKSLENEAREKALADARAKADQIASTLKVKIGKVVSVKDGDQVGGGFPCANGICPVMMSAEDKSTAGTEQSLPVQAGENDFTLSVTVTFEIE